MKKFREERKMIYQDYLNRSQINNLISLLQGL